VTAAAGSARAVWNALARVSARGACTRADAKWQACPVHRRTVPRTTVHRSGKLCAAIAVVGALLASAGTTTVADVLGAPSAAAAPGRASRAQCQPSLLARHRGTVHIAFWESMVTANGTTLQKLTTAFNASQHKVHVTLVQQRSYTTTWIKYQAGLSNGQLPNVVQLTSIDLQGVEDSRSVTPVQSCMKATHYKTSDFIPRVLAAYKLNDVQIGMPFAVSGPVLLYNELVFEKDGITSPPRTLGQLVTDAAILKANGSGIGLKLDPWHLETWLASANQPFVNHDNGRKGRATKAVFDTPVAKKIWADLDQIVRSGAATTNPAIGPEEYDDLLGIGSGKYAMAIDTTAVLGTVEAVLASGKYPNVKLGVAPFPVYSTKVRGGIEVGGSALYISSRQTAADQAASWDYISYLDSTQSQADWAKGTGYIPIRRSSADTATVKSLWSASPGYKVAYEQLVSGANTYATAGAVLGPYTQVRTAELDAEKSMYQSGVSPSTALENATHQIDQILSQYDQRIGS
jgi:sn-glycerol 3-phosphate transport system substrate-binding protein